jgi:hypothetical protein
MRAVQITRFGGPEVLEIVDSPGLLAPAEYVDLDPFK